MARADDGCHQLVVDLVRVVMGCAVSHRVAGHLAGRVAGRPVPEVVARS